MDIDKLIRTRFHIKSGDTLPYKSWNRNITRLDLAKLFAELGYKTGVEVGVSEGRYSLMLCQTIPGLQLTCVDPWQAYERISQRLCDERYRLAVERLTPYGVTFARMTSIEAVKNFPESSLDFVYVDGWHVFDAVMQDIIEWSRRVRKGGIVSGHDYYDFYKAGVRAAVDAYTRAHNIGAFYLTPEREPSWFWVKR
jgi:SAM-dependent methyltransferase